MKNFRHQQHRPKKSALIIGRRAVVNAMESGKQIERIYLQSNIEGAGVDEVKQKAAALLIPVNKVPVEKLNSFNIGQHDGCVALVSKIQYQDLQQVITFIVEKGETPFFLILDGITDIRNIGGIARTAFCCGVHAIIIPDKGVGALNEDAILTSAGALEKLAVCRVSSLFKAVDDLHLNGISVYASEAAAEKDIHEIKYDAPCAIVLGSEEKGVNTALMKICDERFRISMVGNFDSLNVSVAAGIILYEAMKQRNVNTGK